VNTYASKRLEEAVNELSRLPGIGKKSALRLALHLLKQDTQSVEMFGNSIIRMRNEIKYCKICHNISDLDICEICAKHKRDQSIICVVEDIRDVMAIENTGQFVGLYHILGGIISPMDGIGPQDLNIQSLVDRTRNTEIKEVILALSTTIEGDTTNYYISKQLNEFDIELSTIARGISIGDEIEYADEITLGRSIVNRLPYATNLPK